MTSAPPLDKRTSLLSLISGGDDADEEENDDDNTKRPLPRSVSRSLVAYDDDSENKRGVVEIDSQIEIEDATPSSSSTSSTAQLEPTTAPIPTSLLASLSSLLPPEPLSDPDPELEAKVKRFLLLRSQGTRFNESLLNRKDFHNPAILHMIAAFFKIDPYGTNYPKDSYDPASIPDCDIYDVMGTEMLRLKEQKDRERTAVEFVQGPVVSFGSSTGAVSLSSVIPSSAASMTSSSSSSFSCSTFSTSSTISLVSSSSTVTLSVSSLSSSTSSMKPPHKKNRFSTQPPPMLALAEKIAAAGANMGVSVNLLTDTTRSASSGSSSATSSSLSTSSSSLLLSSSASQSSTSSNKPVIIDENYIDKKKRELQAVLQRKRKPS
eukprot:TRINITY_DN438_c0_g1_i1.p1 TRINITY_DN438_c0_g1~~TRINITY_DN438_c0_g1_i1.p1  ORF type:complete len:378 (+),score=107.88 TRINITY_DN438_c0_g1_i1:83-1216(+)